MKDLYQKWKVKLIFRGAWNSLMARPDWPWPPYLTTNLLQCIDLPYSNWANRQCVHILLRLSNKRHPLFTKFAFLKHIIPIKNAHDTLLALLPGDCIYHCMTVEWCLHYCFFFWENGCASQSNQIWYGGDFLGRTGQVNVWSIFRPCWRYAVSTDLLMHNGSKSV